MDKASIIKKIQGLNNLADPSRNATQGEIESAVRLAKKLMAKYSVTPDDMKQAAVKDDTKFVTLPAHEGYLSGWEIHLAAVVENICSVRSFRSLRGNGKSIIIFCGILEEVSVAISMFNILRSLTKDRATKYLSPRPGIKVYAKKGRSTMFRSYAEGFVASLYKTSLEMVQLDSDEEQTQYAIVVADKGSKIDAWMNEEFKIKETKARSRRVDMCSYALGNRDGEKVSLKARGVLE